MAGSQQDVIYYGQCEEKETAQEKERNASRYYTNLICSTLQSGKTGEMVINNIATNWWSADAGQPNRSVSSVIEGNDTSSFAYTSSARHEETAAVNAHFPLNRDNTSFQFNKTDMWSTTFQNSGWLDIYMNTTTTKPSR